MDDQSKPYSDYTVLSSEQKTGSLSKTFMANVFIWMFAALAISAVMAFVFANNMYLMNFLVTETGLSILGWAVMLAPLGFVMAMSFGYN
ncbi:MAG TPA: BAX inhibitor (BI)-1/YccA family protein, partial [Flavipsychrobacter sp.]